MGEMLRRSIRGDTAAIANEYAAIAAGISTVIVAAVGSVGSTPSITFTVAQSTLK
jgi:Flp pilus assembly pilin Flp